MAHDVRCGPKVFAEKAKYYRTKMSTTSGDRVDAQNIVHSDSSETTAREEIYFSRDGSSDVSPDTDYTLPLDSHTLTDLAHLQIKMGFPVNPGDNVDSGIP